MFENFTPFVISLFIVFIFLIGISLRGFWKNKSYNHNTNSDNEKNNNDHSNSQNTNNRFKKQNETNEKDDLSFFGLKPNYTLDELKQARMKKLKENHPDKVNEMSDEIKEIAKKQTQRINDIYTKLKSNLKN